MAKFVRVIDADKVTRQRGLRMLVDELEVEVAAMFKDFVRSTAILVAAVGWSAGASGAQQDAAKPVVVTTPEVVNMAELVPRAKALLAEVKGDSGSFSIVLSQYRGHYTMLTARNKSGGGEIHKRFADFLFVIDGEGTELTGGAMVDGKEQPGGEIRGTRLEGATAHVLHKGDVIHIPAGTPHQAIEAPGQTITIYVVKVEEQ